MHPLRYAPLYFSFVILATAQQNVNHSQRIICTPPRLKILKMVRPVVSPDAKAFGVVAVEVNVDKTGRPASIKVLSGNPILTSAVVDAVRQWRWKPLRLNGVTVEAVSTISVNFEPE
jgi:TonB family protein